MAKIYLTGESFEQIGNTTEERISKLSLGDASLSRHEKFFTNRPSSVKTGGLPPGFARANFKPAPAERPVKFLQGTWEKVLVLMERAEKGQDLWHPLDSTGCDDDAFEEHLKQIEEMKNGER